MDEKLLQLRNDIDQIDDQIAKLYLERMNVVKEVAMTKRENKIGVNHSERENQIVYRLSENAPTEQQIYIKKLYEAVFESSKAYQMSFQNLSSPSKDMIVQALQGERKQFPVRAKVACQGVYGAYSSVAAEKLFEIPNMTFFKSFDSVFNAVEKGFCDFGLLPIENSSVGSVNAVYDLMKEHKFFIVRGVSLQVSHNLLVNDGVKISDIKEIVSHEQAINQCRKYLNERFKDVKITVCDNTATAARLVSESGRSDIASISSKECADVFNLKILDRSIQDSDTNYTRFICISKKFELYQKGGKISFMTTLPHVSGSLNKTLGKFASLGLNLTKLESRPLPDKINQFMFYFDFEGDIENIAIQNLIAEMESANENFTFLGSYLEVRS